MSPSLVVIDEFDALVPKRAEGNTSVTDRVVNQFLCYLGKFLFYKFYKLINFRWCCGVKTSLCCCLYRKTRFDRPGIIKTRKNRLTYLCRSTRFLSNLLKKDRKEIINFILKDNPNF